MSDLPHTLILIVGLIGISKAVWALFATDSFLSFVKGWQKLVPRISGLLGIAALLVGIAIWASFMIYRPLAHWVLLGLGLIYLLFGISTLSPTSSSPLARLFNPPRSKFALRVLALVSIIICTLLLWIAVKDL
ncbi:MAG: hypothetical protein O2923_06135 [Verrucomicrobia bacterium]|nr:hypothetical protein [Verrucomicrobiota bacterium]MDA1087518.1 hypothetical protein [Verrucomicrobiota bacterium]